MLKPSGKELTHGTEWRTTSILNNAGIFLKYANMDAQETYIRASILEAIYKNILTKEGIGIYYMGDKIANSYEDSIAYFLDPQNQTLKVSILEKLTSS